MFSAEHPPLLLIADEQTPSDEVLMAGAQEAPVSDVFPPGSLRHQDVLDGYQGKLMPESPFKKVLNGITSYRSSFYNQEYDNDWRRTDETRRGLATTLLQAYLAECIGRDYDKLLHAGLSTKEAVSKIGKYVLEGEERAGDAYKDTLDALTLDLAALDRHDEAPEPAEIDGIPVLSMREILLATGEIPPSEETAREERKDFLTERIQTVRHRLQRVQFERLSSFTILRFASN